MIAAKALRKTFFEMAARDIRALPKLEGTVHVNIALIVKFMPNYFFNPAEYPRFASLRSDDVFCGTGSRRAWERSALMTSAWRSKASIYPM
jgi:acyl-CoA dehydrogenase